jgi:hypothetical protein
LLGQIEELGWHLEHVSWWRNDADAPVALGTLPRLGAAGHVKGVYLFHAVADVVADTPPAPGPTNGVTHPPSHRREVL